MNTPIKLPKGSITMCDIKDFRDTMKSHHTVVTLCRWQPTWHHSDKNERHHYYFRAHNNDPAIWGHALNLISDLLEEDKDVLVHCVHGRDRTGGVVYMLLKMLGMSHDEVFKMMCDARPSQADEWSDRLNRRRLKYDRIIEEYLNQEREWR